MADPLVASLAGEDVVETNSMAVVTTSCIVIRPVHGRSRVVLSLESVTDIKRIRTTHPGLLVIASGLFLIAAAAYYSKDSSPAVVPIAFLGILFLFAYLGTRRVSVVFVGERESVETGLGSPREAVNLIKAVTAAQLQAGMDDDE